MIDELSALLVARAEAWTGGSLTTLAGRSGLRDDPGEAVVQHLLEHREAMLAWLTTDEPARALQANLVRWLRRRNQFIELDGPSLAGLAARTQEAVTGARELLRTCEPGALRAALRPVFAALREGLAELVRARLGDEPREVTCSEYSPALQLEVLGLEVATLRGPVLDVGCGPALALVELLRAAGLEADGIDREGAPDRVVCDDWLRFNYGVDRWGAVISHLGVSLHLLHHHLAGRPAAFVYTELYMQILRSLRLDGIFAYAPGLPFIERLLPRAQYEVRRISLPANPSLRAAQSATGLTLGHATQVRRLA